MKINRVKEIASQMLNAGVSRIRILPEALEDAKKALTREDIRKLVSENKIVSIPPKERMPKLKTKKKVRKGSAKARQSIRWEDKVRAQRRVLKLLKANKVIDNATFKKVYRLISGNAFSSKSSMIEYLKSQRIIDANFSLESILPKKEAVQTAKQQQSNSAGRASQKQAAGRQSDEKTKNEKVNGQ